MSKHDHMYANSVTAVCSSANIALYMCYWLNYGRYVHACIARCCCRSMYMQKLVNTQSLLLLTSQGFFFSFPVEVFRLEIWRFAEVKLPFIAIHLNWPVQGIVILPACNMQANKNNFRNGGSRFNDITLRNPVLESILL